MASDLGAVNDENQFALLRNFVKDKQGQRMVESLVVHPLVFQVPLGTLKLAILVLRALRLRSEPLNSAFF